MSKNEKTLKAILEQISKDLNKKNDDYKQDNKGSYKKQ